MGTRDEDGGEVNDYKVPEDSREIVQKLNEIFNRSEHEIYAMLVECNKDVEETVNRLLSQDTFRKVKSKRAKKKLVLIKREIVQKLKETLNHSEEEIYAILEDSDMNIDKTVDRLLSQDGFQLVKSKRVKKKKIKDKSDSKSQIVYSNIKDREDCNGIDQGGENKSNLDQTSNVQGINNRSSETGSILGPIPNHPPLNRYQPAWRKTDLLNIDVLKMGLNSPKESIIHQAPAKDDCRFDEKPDAINDQLQVQDPASTSSDESASESNQELRNDDYGDSRLLSDADPAASVVTNEPGVLVKKEKCVLIIPSHLQVNTSELSHLRFGRYGCGQREDVSDFADDLSLKHLNLRDGEFREKEEQRLERNVASEARYEPCQENQYKVSSATDFRFDNSMWLNPVEAPSRPSLQMQNVDTFRDAMKFHQQAYKREPDPRYSAFPYNQSIPSITNASLLGHRPAISMTEAQRSAGAFEPWRNQQAMNQHYSQPKPYPHSQPAWNGGGNNNTSYLHLPLDEHGRITNMRGGFGTLSGNTTAHSQHEVPSGNCSNTLEYPHLQPTRNDMLPSVYQQNGIGNNNNNTCHNQLAAMLSQNRNSVMPQPAFTTSAYGSTNDSANGFGMSSDNTANSRFDYDNFLSNRRNYLPSSVHHQNVNSNTQSGSDYYISLLARLNQQSLRMRQQEEQQPYGELDNERSSLYNSVNSRRRDHPSKQNKQPHPWERNNY